MGQSFDPIELRRVFGTFLTGVTVLTMRDPDGTPRGMTANSFTSVSLDPALVLVCIGRHSSNYEAFAVTEAFAVNILCETQRDIATTFSMRGVDRFAAVDHHVTVTGSPILSDALSWLDCTLHHRMVAGDHILLIGEIQDFSAGMGSPLGYSRGQFVAARDAIARVDDRLINPASSLNRSAHCYYPAVLGFQILITRKTTLVTFGLAP